MAKMIAPNGIEVSAPDSAVETLISRGYKPADKPKAKAPKPSSSAK